MGMPRLRCGATYRKDWAAFRLTVLEGGYVTTMGKARAGEWSERPLKSEDRAATLRRRLSPDLSPERTEEPRASGLTPWNLGFECSSSGQPGSGSCRSDRRPPHGRDSFALKAIQKKGLDGDYRHLAGGLGSGAGLGGAATVRAAGPTKLAAALGTAAATAHSVTIR
jgi:hypothetical protein